MRLGGMLSRLRSGDGTPSAPEALAVADGGAPGSVHTAALAAALLGEKHSEKDLALDSEGELPSPSDETDDDAEDLECGVCLDAAVSPPRPAAVWLLGLPAPRAIATMIVNGWPEGSTAQLELPAWPPACLLSCLLCFCSAWFAPAWSQLSLCDELPLGLAPCLPLGACRWRWRLRPASTSCAWSARAT